MLPNKYLLYAILAFIAISVLTACIMMWRKDIRDKAIQDFNNQQMQIVLEEQKKFNATMKEINDRQQQIIESLHKNNQELNDRLRPFEDYLGSDEAKKSNQESSAVLKRTIENLRRQHK